MIDEDQLNLFNSCIDSLESCLDVVNKYSDQKAKQTKYLKEVVTKDYCTIDLDYEKCTDAISKVEEYIQGEEVDPSADATKLYDSYVKKSKETDYLTHPVWYRIAKTETDSLVEETQVSENEGNETEEYETLDGSLMCSQKKGLPLDPLTKGAIKKPCKNRNCGHIYDMETIGLHIRRKKKDASCPYVGCTKTVTMADICAIEAE